MGKRSKKRFGGSKTQDAKKEKVETKEVSVLAKVIADETATQEMVEKFEKENLVRFLTSSDVNEVKAIMCVIRDLKTVDVKAIMPTLMVLAANKKRKDVREMSQSLCVMDKFNTSFDDVLDIVRFHNIRLFTHTYTRSLFFSQMAGYTHRTQTHII